MTHVTPCRNVVSIELHDTACAFFVAFVLVLLVRERKNFQQFS